MRKMESQNLIGNKKNAFSKCIYKFLRNFTLHTLHFTLLSLPLSAALTSKNVKAEIFSDVSTVEAGKPFTVAIQLSMNHGWHTYWKNPGESGAPTEVTWTLPPGWTAGPLQHPVPQKIVVPPVVTYGYEEEVIFLTEITPASSIASKDVTLAAEVEWLECENVCIPGGARVELALPVGTSDPNERNADLFAQARSRFPTHQTDFTVSALTSGKTYRLVVTPTTDAAPALTSLFFFNADSGVVEASAEQIFRAHPKQYTLDIPHAVTAEATATQLAGILVAEPRWTAHGEQGWEITANVKADSFQPALSSTVPSAPASAKKILLALLFSFIGGLILNLMPCVLPVLSIKILGFVKQSGEDGHSPLTHGGMFAAGVLASFWALASVLLLLRGGGSEIGWGFQLQSPRFIAALASLFFLMGLNLFGVFEVGASLTRLGGLTRGKTGLKGAFFSGVLATFVATPCTAPFMGSALGFALTQPFFIAMAIFTSLALGMALPYVVLTANPHWVKALPKPGAWMETLKQSMGFFMMATVLWLLWVLSRQAGALGILMVLAGFLILSLAAWIYGKSYSTKALIAALIIGASGLGAAITPLATLATGASTETPSAEESSWEVYSEERVNQLRQEGRIVFLDFTAAWCLTCQVNERLVINNKRVQAAFKDKNVALVKADWTNQDPLITKALQSFGRSGVPFYVIYPPDTAKPAMPLSEILTPDRVLQKLEEAQQESPLSNH